MMYMVSSTLAGDSQKISRATAHITVPSFLGFSFKGHGTLVACYSSELRIEFAWDLAVVAVTMAILVLLADLPVEVLQRVVIFAGSAKDSAALRKGVPCFEKHCS